MVKCVFMDLADAKGYLSVIKAEERRRATLLRDEDPDFAYDQWLFTDAPFISELCLVFLVSLRHHVERRLLHFAACAADAGQPIKRADYEERVEELLYLRADKRWKEIEKRLDVAHCAHYATVEALRLLANAYKHDPKKQPNKELLTHLGLDLTLTYAQLPESKELQKALALIVGLAGDAEYCDITERFVERVQEFLNDLQARNALSRVNWGKVSLTDFAH